MGSMVSNAFLFNFEGRINRAKYWYAVFASSISCGFFLSIVAVAIGGILGVGPTSLSVDFLDVARDPLSLPFNASFGNAGPTSAAALSFYVRRTPIFIIGFWFLVATTIKRLHDRDKSGWWIVPFFIAPALFDKIGDRLDDSDLAVVTFATVYLTLAASVISFWAFVETMFLKGTRGPNRFGPDPMAPVDTDTRAISHWQQSSELGFVPHSAGPPPAPHVMRGHE